MGDGNLGIVLALAVDQAQAVQEANLAGENIGRSFENAGQRVGPLNDALGGVDKNLLSSRESARLFTETLGIGMPRAVTSAFAEIMPAIGSAGTALLGLFAVKEVVKFGGEVHKLIDEFDGVAAAEKRAQEIEKDNLGLLEKQIAGNKKLLLGELTRAQFRAIQDEKDLNASKDRWQEALLAGDMNALAIDLVTGALSEQGEAQGKLTADQRIAAEMAKLLIDLNEKEAKADENAAEAARKRAEAEEKTHKFLIYGPPLLAGWAEGARKSAEAVNNWRKAWEDFEEFFHRPLAELPIAKQDFAAMVPVIYQNVEATNQHTTALQAWGKAMQSDVVAQAQQLTIGLAGLVAGRKAQAAVEVVWETAEGIACLATGTWPPNPAAIIAAGLHFEAAAQYAKLGGGGGGGRRGASSAGAGRDSGAGNSTSSGAGAIQRGGGGGGAGGAGGSGVTMVSIPGNLSVQGQQQMAAWLGIGAGAGIFKISQAGVSGVSAGSTF